MKKQRSNALWQLLVLVALAAAALMLISPSPGVSPAASPFRDARLSGRAASKAARPR